MHIIFDTSSAPFTPGGTRTYIEQLAHALQARQADTLRIVPSHLPAWLHPDGTKGFQHKLKVAAWDTYYTQLLLPTRTRVVQADLLHMPTFRLPVRSTVPVVTTILDVIPLVFPHLFRLREKLTIGAYLRLCRRQATHIVTISEQSRQDIHRYLKISLDRITVTYPAASAAFQPVASQQISGILAQYDIDQPYILSVATLEPRKNLVRVLEAFAALQQQHKVPHQLVLVGRLGWKEGPIFQAVEALNIMHKVRFTGFVPDSELPALYSGADVFVYPSLYEGFGLPPLEAMRCACPVITSNLSSLPEVVGDAALTVDPYDIAAISNALAEVLSDTTLADQLRQQGQERAQLFTWERCAEETIAVYQRVLGTTIQPWTARPEREA